MVAYGGGKKQENFKLLAVKVVAVAYEKWSLARASKHSYLTWKVLVFWKTGRCGEVIATGGLTVSLNVDVMPVYSRVRVKAL